MNTMVVSVMSGNVHASIKALEGYCMFHRMLHVFVKHYPALQETINKTALRFIENDENRGKNVIPSLGEFLPLLTLATAVTWDQVAIPYLEENFDRNVLWAIKKYPKLANIDKVRPGQVDVDRINKTFSATTVSLRLLCFHVYFFRHIARPVGVSIDDIAFNYDRFFGRPSNEMKNNLQKNIFEILKINTWPEFFTSIGLAVPSREYLTNWLVQSVLSSERKGYHRRYR